MNNNEISKLGEEKISKLLLKFSLPCVMGLLISSLYNIVDQIFIGNSELGYLGNAATGVSFPVICIANAFAWCIGDGAASFLSICSGRKDTERAHKCIGTGITATTIVSIVLTVICVVFIEPLMRLFGASHQTLTLSVDYFKIIAFMFPVYLLMNVMNSMIRADGSPTFAMIAMSTGAVINLILDPLFIYTFKLGIKGAAFATAIGQLASFSLCVFYMFRPKSFKLTAKSFIPSKGVLNDIVALGMSTFINQISIVIMSLVCNMTLASFGALSKYGQDIPISVFSIQTKIFTLVGNIAIGIVLGGQPIFGYNYGAQKWDRVRKTYRLVLLTSASVGVIATLIFQFFPDIIINLFGGGNELYMEFARKTLRIYLAFICITCIIRMSSIFFQSIGKPLYATISSLVRDIICFTPLALFLTSFMEKRNSGSGINGLLIAAPIADAVAGIVIVLITVSFFKKIKKS